MKLVKWKFSTTQKHGAFQLHSNWHHVHVNQEGQTQTQTEDVGKGNIDLHEKILLDVKQWNLKMEPKKNISEKKK